jgi:transcriptional regulator with XRE-family HTH domain
LYNKTLLGVRLRLLRDKLKLKQEDVADKLGCHQGAISNLERGVKAPSIDMLFSLSQLFDVSVDYLLGVSDEPNPARRPTEGQENIDINAPAILKETNTGYEKSRKGQADKKPGHDEIDMLIEELDEESMVELRKYIAYLRIRQTLDSGKDERSAGLDGERVK